MQTSKQELEELLKQKKELDERISIAQNTVNNLTVEQELAETFHLTLCGWNHTDGCGWFYESWNDPGYSRNKYLDIVHQIIKICNSRLTKEEIIEIVKILAAH